MATVDQGYHVYVAVWEAAIEQILPCQRGANVHNPYAVAVAENNCMPHCIQSKISLLKLPQIAPKPRNL